jgi:hypothetical protein
MCLDSKYSACAVVSRTWCYDVGAWRATSQGASLQIPDKVPRQSARLLRCKEQRKQGHGVNIVKATAVSDTHCMPEVRLRVFGIHRTGTGGGDAMQESVPVTFSEVCVLTDTDTQRPDRDQSTGRAKSFAQRSLYPGYRCLFLQFRSVFGPARLKVCGRCTCVTGGDRTKVFA